MNELSVDAQMDFPTTQLDRDGDSPISFSAGEVWQCTSCPFDPTLVVTCSTNMKCQHRSSETVLWRMPKEALREDELEYYPSSSDVGVGGGGASSGVGVDDYDRNATAMTSGRVMGSGSFEGNGSIVLDMVASLPHSTSAAAFSASADGISSDGTRRNILNGRVSDMVWNPECFPDMYESNSFIDYEDEEGHSNDDQNYDLDADGEDQRVGKKTYHNSNRDNTNSNNSPHAAGGVNFVTVEHGTSIITTWDLQTSAAIPISRTSLLEHLHTNTNTRMATIMTAPPKASWDPHNTNLIAASCGKDVCIIDLRCSETSSIVHTLQSCHRLGVSDIDHNPNKPNVFSTCGKDGTVKFWDLRYSGSTGTTTAPMTSSPPSSPLSSSDTMSTFSRQEPLKTLRGGHCHWTTVVKYNSFHDQLLLSGGTDGVVNLWRISSISSAPVMDLGSGSGAVDASTNNHNDDDGSSTLNEKYGFSNQSNDEDDDRIDQENTNFMIRSNDEEDNDDGIGDDEDNENKENGGKHSQDIRVMKMESSESVYGVAWSAADPWIFASVGFDGRVVLNHVPSTEKYKILL